MRSPMTCGASSAVARTLRRAALAGAGLLTAAIGFAGLHDPLASMADYTAALMLLNQAAPPLLLWSLPRAVRSPLFDPVIAIIAFVTLSVAVSLPGLLDPTLADALYAAPLGVLELLTGLMVWAQLCPRTTRLRHGWSAALLGWLAGLPMTIVAVIWMLASQVLYTPYLDVVCRWDIPPLLDQRWAGFVMFVAGLPLQIAAAWLLVVRPGVVALAES